MKRVENIVFVCLMLLLFPMFLNAQKEQGLKPKVKWNIRGQFWLRYSDLNEGSLINGEPTSNYTDVSIRRLRIPISTQVTPKIYAYALFGGNNYNFKSKDAKIGVLDLYVEYSFSKLFEVGLGKSGWQGLNRWNVRSSKTLMGLDSPLFSLNTVGKNDDLGR